MKETSRYPKGAMWTLKYSHKDDYKSPECMPLAEPPDSYERVDLGIIEIQDDGDFVNDSQLYAIRDRIISARRHNANGAIVVTFVHGWHNNAAWDNKNLESFRGLLRALMLREIEWHNRHVIGVYIGWNGDPKKGWRKWLSRLPVATHTSFHDRYEVAGNVGRGDALTTILTTVSEATKGDLGKPGQDSPLVFAGHSMGAFILQSCMLTLLETGELIYRNDNPLNEVSITMRNGLPVHMPNLVLSLNSAAENAVAEQLIMRLHEDGWEKQMATDRIRYNPPMMVSITSKADRDTGLMWRIAKLGDKTDGHDKSLATHTFEAVGAPDDTQCEPLPDLPDFGQAWHCIHGIPTEPTPRLRIDLPIEWPKNRVGRHQGYELIPRNPLQPSPLWLFQVPGKVSKDHGDVFNYQVASLTLAMIQVSGALVSGTADWGQVFTP